MIPKIIHYCWFGHNHKTKLVRKCIRSWRKYCPDYQIIEWNEDNYDISSSPLFVQQAIQEGKWAFASDYVRLRVVYEHGGFYLDTDVELVKSLDELVYNKIYFGLQDKANNCSIKIATGLGFGAEKGAPLLLEIMEIYEARQFILPDGTYDLTWNTRKETEVLLRHGLKQDGSEQLLDDGVHIYPSVYFNPKVISPCIPVRKTKHTISIHWYASSWFSDREKREESRKRRKSVIKYYLHIPHRAGRVLLGDERYEKLKSLLKRR